MHINDISYKELMENMDDGVYFVDSRREITFWNKAAEKITGYKAEEVIGKHCFDNILIHTDVSGTLLCQSACPLTEAIEKGCTQNAETVYLHHRAGYRVPVSVKVIPFKDAFGAAVGAVEIFSEKSKDSILVEELRKMAFFDSLTEMGNRRHADTNLKSRFAEMKRYATTFGVLFVDIDNFKRINDTFGHETGDNVLRMVAKTIEKNIRELDTVSRWGGEEFLIILEKIRAAELPTVSKIIHTLIGRSMLLVNDKPLSVTVSIGATMATMADNPKSLIARADKLMYAGKLAGKDRVTLG